MDGAMCFSCWKCSNHCVDKPYEQYQARTGVSLISTLTM